MFVKEVQLAVLDGRADLAQHSAKDLPAITPDGLVLAAVPERGDPRDALVGSTFGGLPTGARVATGSVRRRAQLAAARPDLTFAELRGNVDTRLEKASQFDAIVLAAAGLDRLGRSDRITERLDTSVMLPMVGQGALAIECRADDDATRARLASIDNPEVHTAVRAERAFLAELGGGCAVPASALARIGPDGRLRFRCMVSSLDGKRSACDTVEGTVQDAATVGRDSARRVLADGGRELLQAAAR
jgi:hydroxymethylbilane synthase